MIYRVAIFAVDSCNVFLQITSSPAFWTVTGGWTPISGTLTDYGVNDTDSGQNLYLESWRFGGDVKIREFGIVTSSYTNDTLLYNTGYGPMHYSEVWLEIDAGNLTSLGLKVWCRESRACTLVIRTAFGGQQVLTVSPSNDEVSPYVASIVLQPGSKDRNQQQQ